MSTKELRALRSKIAVKLAVQLKNEFYAACKLESETMQDVLYRYIISYTDSKRDRLATLDGRYVK